MIKFIALLYTTIMGNKQVKKVMPYITMGLFNTIIRDIPTFLYNLFIKSITSELKVTSNHDCFYQLMDWINENTIDFFIRSLKLNNGKWGYNKLQKTVGDGTHYIFYKKNILKITLLSESNNKDKTIDKDIVIITKLGRNKKLFDDIINSLSTKHDEKSKDKLIIYNYYDYWGFVKYQYKRDLNSIFIKNKDKSKLTNLLKDFIKNESWFKEKGIPYHLGILLYGPPGTGKTSLIKAIASYLNYPLYIMNPQKISKLLEASSTLPDKGILVIEDIDSALEMYSRNRDNPKKEEKLEKKESNEEREEVEIIKKDDPSTISYFEEFSEIFMRAGLSGVLNSLDGLIECHGRILIMTTNHKEVLDPAILRPGRIDLQLEIGYVDNEIFKEFLISFFPNKKKEIMKKSFLVKPEITVAELQQTILEKYTYDEIIDNFIYKEKE